MDRHMDGRTDSVWMKRGWTDRETDRWQIYVDIHMDVWLDRKTNAADREMDGK